MSLLDNKKGLTILSALFLLFACEEPSELPLGITPKQGVISTHYVEIPVEVAHFKIESDSVISSLASENASILIGRATNDQLGTLTATAFTNIGTIDSVSYPTAADLEREQPDSIKLSLNYNKLFLGNNFSAPQTLKVYRLKKPIAQKPAGGTGNLQYKYFTTDQESLEGAELIGETTFDTASVNRSGLKNTVVINLSDEFATEIWQQLKTQSDTLRNQELFDQFIGSLAIVPGENNTFINGYLFNSLASGIDLYFGSTVTASSGYVTFPFRPLLKRTDGKEYNQLPIYYNLTADYTNTALEGAGDLQLNTPFQASDNQLYFRSGVGFLPKISFPGLGEFVTSNNLDNIIINSAILEIDSVQWKIGDLMSPAEIGFYLVEDENNRRFSGVRNEDHAGVKKTAADIFVTAQKDTLLRYRIDLAEEVEKFISLNEGSKVTENSRRFLQGMIYNSDNDKLTLPNTLPNLVADPQHVVLKIYYTLLDQTNQKN